MSKTNKKAKRERKVILLGLPPGFLDDLPQKDQLAISKVTCKRITLRGYDADGRAELEFNEADGTIHSLYVKRSFSA